MDADPKEEGMDMPMKMIMQMTFYWSTKVTFLFEGADIESGGIYFLALVLSFGIAMLVEWLNYLRYNI